MLAGASWKRGALDEIKTSNDVSGDITISTSHTLTKAGEEKVVEGELEQIYNQAGVDCLEVDMGLLVYRKEGIRWQRQCV